MQLEYNNFKRDSLLYAQGNQMFTITEYENSRQAYIQVKSAYIGQQASLKNTWSNILQMEEELMELDVQKEENIIRFRQELNDLKQQLESKIKIWEEKFLIKTRVKTLIQLLDRVLEAGNNERIQRALEKMNFVLKQELNEELVMLYQDSLSRLVTQ